MRSLVWMITVASLLAVTDVPAKQSRKGTAALAADAESAAVNLRIAYLHRPTTRTFFPYFDPPAADSGLQGARLGIKDNNTTGRFTGQIFALNEISVDEGDDPASVFLRLLAEGYRHILVDLPAASIERLSLLPGAEHSVIYDVGSTDDRLREAACSTRVLHLLPSRSMRADALAQYLVQKRWTKWFLIVGRQPSDRLYADAVERAAKRFGGKIVAIKVWEYDFADRRTPEAVIPVFTQGADHDVLIVADEAAEFGDLLPYRSWFARPVVGTQGLVPSAWHRTHEAWGALQLQKRFREQAGRWMDETDYGAWLAIRAIGEAATRAKTVEFDAIANFLRSDQFALAGFKGVPLSFRSWDGQLRQPVLLAHERALVAVAPIEGFIHPRNELDTLGYDQSESVCDAKR